MKDEIFQVLLKYNFNLHRDDNTIYEYIKNHCKTYYEDINRAMNGNNPFLTNDFIELLNSKVGILDGVCSSIPKVIEKIENGDIIAATECSFILFDDMKDYFIKSPLDESYTRIRKGDYRINNEDERKIKKAELFHIKKKYRKNAGAYRFSCAGQPCLYLSTSAELAWFECGLPLEFSYCNMRMNGNGENVCFLDLSRRPIEYLSSIKCELYNAKDLTRKKELYEKLIEYIITYPVSAACSLKVKDRTMPYIEEYAFPQILLQWVKERSEYDGIKYKSSFDTYLVNGMGSVNVVLPVVEYREDGLDKKMASIMEVSDIGYMDVTQVFANYRSELLNIKEYVNELELFMACTPYAVPYMPHMVEFCNSVVRSYEAIIDGEYTNSKLMFEHLDLLYEHMQSLLNDSERLVKECVEQELEPYKSEIDEDELKNQFERLKELMDPILHKHMEFFLPFERLDNYEII